MNRADVKRHAGNLFIERRAVLEPAVVVVLVIGFLASTSASNFMETLTKETRRTLYGSVAGSAGALLGFVLAALSILVALPSTERIVALREHPKWPRIPSAFFRAAVALLAALILCTLGIALDSARSPWKLYETITVGVLALAVVRVVASIVALDQILTVARTRTPRRRQPDDPGP